MCFWVEQPCPGSARPRSCESAGAPWLGQDAAGNPRRDPGTLTGAGAGGRLEGKRQALTLPCIWKSEWRPPLRWPASRGQQRPDLAPWFPRPEPASSGGLEAPRLAVTGREGGLRPRGRTRGASPVPEERARHLVRRKLDRCTETSSSRQAGRGMPGSARERPQDQRPSSRHTPRPRKRSRRMKGSNYPLKGSNADEKLEYLKRHV